MCSGSETGSYLRLIDFVYHSTLGLRVIKKNLENDDGGRHELIHREGGHGVPAMACLIAVSVQEIACRVIAVSVQGPFSSEFGKFKPRFWLWLSAHSRPDSGFGFRHIQGQIQFGTFKPRF